jgi:hypothetical protein
MFSNLPPGRVSPFFVQQRRHARGVFVLSNSLRLDVFAISACGPAEPIGTLLTRRRPTTNLTSPARSRPLRRANLAPMSFVALSHAERRRMTRRLS